MIKSRNSLRTSWLIKQQMEAILAGVTLASCRMKKSPLKMLILLPLSLTNNGGPFGKAKVRKKK
jgi:hypothetical protein